MDKIPLNLFSEIHKSMPIVCIDIVPYVEDRVFLIKRKLEPACGQYWFPGGRLYKNEHPPEAVKRIMFSETNINIRNLKFLGVHETIFKEDPFNHGTGTHTINLVYSTKIGHLDIFNVVLDNLHDDHKIFKLDEIYMSDLDPYIKKFIMMDINGGL